MSPGPAPRHPGSPACFVGRRRASAPPDYAVWYALPRQGCRKGSPLAVGRSGWGVVNSASSTMLQNTAVG